MVRDFSLDFTVMLGTRLAKGDLEVWDIRKLMPTPMPSGSNYSLI